MYHWADVKTWMKAAYVSGQPYVSIVMKHAHATTIPSSSPPPYNSPPRKTCLSLFVYILMVFIIFVVVLYSEDFACLFDQVPLQSSLLSSPSRKIDDVRKVKTNFLFVIGRTTEGCDHFSARWVRDESSRPIYEESECPYIQPQLTCQEHGRSDSDYQYWRWQPYGCSLPRFNATLMLKTLRGKRMMFVGDSLNRGKFISLVCLLHSIIPQGAKSMETRGSLTIFTIKNHNATIEFYWAPFLLESNSDNAIVHRISDRIVREGSINTHGKHWKGANIIVFNTYLWWMTGLKMKVLKGFFDDEVRDVMEVPTEGAYGMGLKRMLKWVRRNMNLNNSRVFFVTMSPSHQKVDWGAEPGGNCYSQTTMIDDPSYWGSDCRKNVMRVLTKFFSETTVSITVLNITQLSSYRRDAHTSIYKKQSNTLTSEQLANPASYVDCVHWCLPGLQDVWNELLFNRLFLPIRNPGAIAMKL